MKPQFFISMHRDKYELFFNLVKHQNSPNFIYLFFDCFSLKVMERNNKYLRVDYYYFMKPRTKRVKTEPSFDDSRSHSSINSPRESLPRSHDSRKCECCSNLVKYPDYLSQLRKQRLERKEKLRAKKESLEEEIDFAMNDLTLQKVEERLEENQYSSHKKSISENGLEITPEKKKPLLQSFHGSLMKSKGKLSPSIQNILLKDKKTEAKLSFKFIIRLQFEGKCCYSRNFSAPEYGFKAIQCIQNIIKAHANE